MYNPLVTVFIPTFNRRALLQRAIESALSQTYVNIEVIVVDDGSVDGTVEYLNELAYSEQRLRVFVNEGNKGACFSRNKAIYNAKGKFITALDDDDYFQPQRVGDFVDKWLCREPTTIALTSSRIKRFSDDHVLCQPGRPLLTLHDLYLRNPVGTTFFLETKVARDIGGFDPNLPAWQDLEFLMRLMHSGNIESVMNYSYIIDVSHPHERISTASYSRVAKAFDYILDKHKLNRGEQRRLRSQLLVYKFDSKAAMKQAFEFLVSGDIDGLKAIVARFYRARLKRPIKA